MTRKFRFLDAIKKLLQDSLIGGIKYLVKFLLEYTLGITGGSIILVAISLLLPFLSWLKIPIIIPAYAVAIGMVLVMVGIVLFPRLQRKLKSSKHKSVILGGLLFELMRDGTVVGPLCARCKAKPLVMYDQDDNIIRVIFGKDTIYKYICTCGHQTIASKQPSKFLQEAQEYFHGNSAGHSI